jgi:hypothetical protein
MSESQTPPITSLTELMSEESLSLLDSSGTDLVRVAKGKPVSEAEEGEGNTQ